jgi:ABC-type uncharacterized transport system substrate-binding protein
MELHADPSAESSNAVDLRGFAKTTSNTVDLAQEVFDNVEGIVRVYDNEEDFTSPDVAKINALIKAKGRMISA